MAATTEVKIYPKPKKVAKRVALEIRRLVLSANSDRFDIALSGGTTPKKLFKSLVDQYKNILPWERIHFWWGDERCVPPDDDQSNYKMTFDTLFSKIEIPADNIHRIRGEKTPEEEAERYAAEIADNLELRNGVPVFDLIILGLGEDGHTASIFPDQLDLLKVDKLCAVATHPDSGQKRITLTGKVINNANNIFFLVTGQQKAKRLSEIMNNEEVAQNHPAAHIEPHEGSVIWFIDETAALEIG